MAWTVLFQTKNEIANDVLGPFMCYSQQGMWSKELGRA